MRLRSLLLLLPRPRSCRATFGFGDRRRALEHRLGVEVVVAAARQVLGVGPREIARPRRRQLDDARRQLGDEPAIVRHEQQRPLVRRSPSTSAWIASRSRWLVGSSSTSTFGRSTMSRAKMSRAASPPDSEPIGFSTSSPGEEHAPELPAHEGRCSRRGTPPRRSRAASRSSSVEHLVVVLREVADARLVPQLDAAARRRRRCRSTILSSVDLPRPLGPMTRDPLAAPDDERHVAQHLLVAVRLATRRRPRARRLPLGRSGTKRNSGARRELSASSSTSIRSICLSRLCACLALVALAPKRSTKARLCAIISSARAISASLRARAACLLAASKAA